MKTHITNQFAAQLDPWARDDERYIRLAVLDALLDGEFYDCLPYAFYEETTSGEGAGAKYVPVRNRRPSFQFNLYNMVADHSARKTFSGRHAPHLVHDEQVVKEAAEAIKEECSLESVMIEAVHWGSVGSVCTIFQIVPFTDNAGKARSKVVAKNMRVKDCTPTFNKLNELKRLRVHYKVAGADYLNADPPVYWDFEEKEVKGDQPYWLIQDYTETEEVTYKPVPLDKWKPSEVRSIVLIEEERVQHDLGFVPAQWHQYRTGTAKGAKAYDGRCYWSPAITNIIDLDYTVSQIGSGVRYNAVPQVVVKGTVTNTDQDGALSRGASRFIQIDADIVEGDEQVKNSNVYMLEAKGEGMKVGLQDWATLVLRLAMQQICASLKDPNKITTAMSGKGMEILESEFYDLASELRTTFGDNGYLKLLKKILVACILKNHSLLEGITIQEVDGLTLGWPPLSPIGMSEFQAMANALAQLVEAKILEIEESTDFARGQLDMPKKSANKDYLPTLQGGEESEEETDPPTEEKSNKEDEEKAIEQNAKKIQKAASAMVARGQLSTKLR